MEPTPPDLPPESDRKMPVWLIIVMSIVGLLVIAFGVCITMITLRF